MRIVIDIDGDNVAVHTDRALPDSDSTAITDAGPVPAELLRQFGRGRKAGAARGKRASAKPEGEAALNPLRAGELVARQRLAAYAQPAYESEVIETTDAGKAPALPKRRPTGSKRKRSARKK